MKTYNIERLIIYLSFILNFPSVITAVSPLGLKAVPLKVPVIILVDETKLCMVNEKGFSGRLIKISLEELSTADCELILLSSEPYPFKQKHVKALQEQLPDKKIILVDGEMFSWYGSRLVNAASYFQQLQTHALSLVR